MKATFHREYRKATPKQTRDFRFVLSLRIWIMNIIS